MKRGAAGSLKGPTSTTSLQERLHRDSTNLDNRIEEMMNVVGVALLAGLLVVVPPEPQEPPLLHPYEPPHLLHSAQQAAKKAAQKLVCDHPPCPPTALDTLKESLHHGYQKTANTVEGAKEFVTDHVEAAKESVEDPYQAVKDSVHGTAEKAASFIPGKKVKEYLGSHADELDPASYIMPGVGETMESLKRKLDDGRPEASSSSEDSPAMDSLRTKIEQASTYMPSTEPAISRIQDKVRDMQQDTGDAASDMKKGVGDMIGDADDRRGECRVKLGGFLQSLKEKLARSVGKESDSNGLDMRVHELCSRMLEEGGRAEENAHMGTKPDGSPLHESYAYLVESALKAIDGSKDVFEKAIEGEGAEWKEKYMYLAETARGAVEGAKEIFYRAALTATDDIKHSQDGHEGAQKYATAPKKVPDGHLMTSLKEAAIHTKHRISATIRSLMRTLYLASFAAAFGVTLWITFFSGHLLSRALQRQQLAVVQSKVFPTYLRAVTGCLVICTFGHMVLHPWPSANWWERLQLWNFSFSLVVSLFNTFLLEPKITKIMFEKLKIEKEEGRGQSGEAINDETMARLASVNVKFRGLHQVASFANLATVAGLSWHLWYLANRLVV